MEAIRTIPVFNKKLADALTAEGYIIHHTDGNVNNPAQKVYYFIFVPGIFEDMNELGYKQCNAKKKNIPVFSLRLATQLINHGFVLNHTNKNKNNPKLKIYFFRNAPGLMDEIAAYQKEAANAKR